MANWAIVIGVDHYPASSEWSLRGAVRDALTMRKWLLDPQGGKVPEENLFLLLSPKLGSQTAGVASEIPTYDNIVMALQRLLKRSEGQGKRFFFHFSGHGLAIPKDFSAKEGILASDFSEDFSTHSLTIDSLFTRFQATEFEEQFFFIDACRNMPFETKRLGEFPDAPPPLSPARPQFVLYATQRGAKAKEIGKPGDETGAFTMALTNALSGVGLAKAWDEQEKSYLIRWEALVKAVVQDVRGKKIRADAAPGGPLIQEPRQYGERGGEDPELCRFPAGSFPDERLLINLAPSPRILPLATIKIFGELSGIAAELTPPIRAVPVITDLPPRTYGVLGEASGYRPTKLLRVPLYKSESVTLEFEEDPSHPAPPASPGPRSSVSRSPLGSSDKAAPARISYGPAASSGAPSVAELDATGGIEVRAPEDLALLQVANEAGRILGTGRGHLSLRNLPLGFYTLRLLSPEGSIVAETVETPEAGAREVELSVPDTRSPAMQRLVQTAGFETFPSGAISPSETVGPTAFLKLSTVLALAAGAGLEAEAGHGYKLRSLPIPRFEGLVGPGVASGLFIIFGDEHEEGFWNDVEVYDSSSDEEWALAGHHGSDLLQALAIAAQPGIHTARIVWGDRQALLPYHVLPGRVTVFVVTRELDDAIEIHQYMPLSGVHDPGAIELPEWKRRDPFFSQSYFAAMRRIEYMQRSFAKGRISPLAPDIELLLYDKWNDPIAGCLGGYLAERLGTFDPNSIDVATRNLVMYFGELPDSHILRGCHLRRTGRTEEAKREFVIAIRHGVPVFRDGASLLRDHLETLSVKEAVKGRVSRILRELGDGGPWNMKVVVHAPERGIPTMEVAREEHAIFDLRRSLRTDYLDASPGS